MCKMGEGFAFCDITQLIMMKSFQHVRHWVDVPVHIFTEAQFWGLLPLKFAFLDQIWQGCPLPMAPLNAAWEMHPVSAWIWRIQLVFNLQHSSSCKYLRLKHAVHCKIVNYHWLQSEILNTILYKVDLLGLYCFLIRNHIPPRTHHVIHYACSLQMWWSWSAH